MRGRERKREDDQIIQSIRDQRKEEGEGMEVAAAKRVLQSLIRGFAIGYAIKMSSSILFEVLLKTHGLRWVKRMRRRIERQRNDSSNAPKGRKDCWAASA